jgi:hypothetical protein
MFYYCLIYIYTLGLLFGCSISNVLSKIFSSLLKNIEAFFTKILILFLEKKESTYRRPNNFK